MFLRELVEVGRPDSFGLVWILVDVELDSSSTPPDQCLQHGVSATRDMDCLTRDSAVTGWCIPKVHYVSEHRRANRANDRLSPDGNLLKYEPYA